ncbi:unnamed protein product [Diplocarpon coronariae]
MHPATMLLVAALALSSPAQVFSAHTRSHSPSSRSSPTRAPAIPTPTFVTPPPPGESKSFPPCPPRLRLARPTSSAQLTDPTAYAAGYPLCAIPGYTVVPGNYTETIQQESGSDLECCLDQCVADAGAPATDTSPARGRCLSVAFHKRYTECLFFDRVVQETQLEVHDGSEFVHYDLGCKVGLSYQLSTNANQEFANRGVEKTLESDPGVNLSLKLPQVPDEQSCPPSGLDRASRLDLRAEAYARLHFCTVLCYHGRFEPLFDESSVCRHVAFLNGCPLLAGLAEQVYRRRDDLEKPLPLLEVCVWQEIFMRDITLDVFEIFDELQGRENAGLGRVKDDDYSAIVDAIKRKDKSGLVTLRHDNKTEARPKKETEMEGCPRKGEL